MTETVTKQKLKSLRAGWYIWLFPAFAIAISVWLFWDYWQQRGPHIKISFEDGSQIQPGKTQIRYRGVTIGDVQKVTISEDKKDVIAHAILQKHAEEFAVAGTRFWLVTPKVSLQGVSGLETLIEGAYISVDPGKIGGELKTEFKGKEGGESKDPLEDTSTYQLETNDLGSVSAGDSVTFRGMKIGTVTKETLSKTGQTVLLQINILNRYVRVIRTNTVFWRSSGISAKLGLFKSELKIDALDTVLRGGIELATPSPAGEIAKAQAKFPLQADPPKEYEKWNTVLE
ncbi:hypothetical protein AZI87_03610 [Bdellovibrio bacteriovorus]|uniref:Mce/MlaD domain-containing protein n=1 Tax=Bdellovibrio bacteriovorus TaxID=959 RepID=A0A162GK63_BDEBC|nr:MlaD family protein [Bdellovibrio bacteriovorus]KYG68352.1 hypothetical protein AZI87_03610 [Bdellovibrio bacteriovorus]